MGVEVVVGQVPFDRKEPFTLNPPPCNLYPTPYAQHPAPYTIHPTPCTLLPTPYSLKANAGTTPHQVGVEVVVGQDPPFRAALMRASRLALAVQILFSTCLDLYHKSSDTSERQCKSRK